MQSPCTLLLLYQSERVKFSALSLDTVEQIMATFVGGMSLRVCGSARFVALTQITPQESQLFSHRRSVITEASDKLQPSLVESTERTLGWECVFGQGEGKTCPEIEGNALESKATPVSYCTVSLCWGRRQSTRCEGQRKVLSVHQGINMTNCALPGNTAHTAFDKVECVW